MNRIGAIALTSLLAVSAAHAVSPHVLSPAGLGSVKIGMTLVAAEHALGAKLSIEYPEDPSCGEGARSDGRDDSVGYLVKDGRIARIEIDQGSKHPATPKVVTALGVGVGTPEVAVLKAYRGAIRTQAHPYLGDEGHYLIVNDKDGRRGFIFETDLKTVTSFRAGRYPALGYIEGCL